MKPLPRLIAHRGDRARYPENTLPALTAAVEQGVQAVEIDVQVAADGIPVLLHDATLERTAGRPGCALDLPAQALRRIPVGEPARFGARFAHVLLPTLAEAVAALDAHPAVHLFVELKEESLARCGAERMVGQVARALAGARFDWTLISFAAEAVAAARHLTRHPVGWVLRACDEASRRQAVRLAPEFLFVHRQRIAGALWPGGWRWVAYGVETPDQARTLFAAGCDAVEVDDLARFADAVTGPGCDTVLDRPGDVE